MDGHIEHLRESSPGARAWALLLQDDSAPYAVEPWNDEAIAVLEEAVHHNRSDPHLLHHLALAVHARAWDLELQEADAAFDAWERALTLWLQLCESEDFWLHLRNKGASLPAPADAADVESVREELIEDLAGIHVDFAEHYCTRVDPAKDSGPEHDRNRQMLDRARDHVELARDQALPAAVRDDVEDRLYDRLSDSVDDQVAAGQYSAAMDRLRICHELLPSHMDGMIRALEVLQEWIEATPTEGKWSVMEEIIERAEVWARDMERALETEDNSQAEHRLATLSRAVVICMINHVCAGCGVSEDRDIEDLRFPPDLRRLLDPMVLWGERYQRHRPGQEANETLSHALWLRHVSHGLSGDIARASADYERAAQLDPDMKPPDEQ